MPESAYSATNRFWDRQSGRPNVCGHFLRSDGGEMEIGSVP